MKTLVDHQLVSWADHSDETETKEKLRKLITVHEVQPMPGVRPRAERTLCPQDGMRSRSNTALRH
jgi:hypothetical protein